MTKRSCKLPRRPRKPPKQRLLPLPLKKRPLPQPSPHQRIAVRVTLAVIAPNALARRTPVGIATLRHATQTHAQSSDDPQRDSQQAAQPPVQAAPPVAAPVPAPPPPPQPLTATFPPGTTVEVQTVDPVDTTTNHVGDEFQATLAKPLTSAGIVVV